MVIPYLPSLDWYRRGSLPARLNRTMLSGGLRLVVPVAGGSSTVKHGNPESWIVSPHGNWPKNHWGAIEAAYSRTPFFAHYAGALHDILMKPHASFAALTGEIHLLFRSLLDFRLLGDAAAANPAVAGYARELHGDADPDISFLDALMRFGPDAIFLLLGRYNNSGDHNALLSK